MKVKMSLVHFSSQRRFISDVNVCVLWKYLRFNDIPFVDKNQLVLLILKE